MNLVFGGWAAAHCLINQKLRNLETVIIDFPSFFLQGYAAKGYFEVTNDVTNLTCADLFSEVGKRTPVTVRFSTVIHPRGSSEGLRDPRGFAVKFYTDHGNWDLVGNNMPVSINSFFFAFFLLDFADFLRKEGRRRWWINFFLENCLFFLAFFHRSFSTTMGSIFQI